MAKGCYRINCYVQQLDNPHTNNNIATKQRYENEIGKACWIVQARLSTIDLVSDKYHCNWAVDASIKKRPTQSTFRGAEVVRHEHVLSYNAKQVGNLLTINYKPSTTNVVTIGSAS